MTGSALLLIMGAALVASASPGPATLAIANTSMEAGRRQGMALAAGVLGGSLTWSIAAAFGLGAVMLANAWMFEVIRYAGAGYLLFLAYKSARSALQPLRAKHAGLIARGSVRRAFLQGLALHLTNPKAVLFFGALYSIGLPVGATTIDIALVIIAVFLQSVVVFFFYAFLFSTPGVMVAYLRLRRGFDGLIALLFGAAGLRILTTRLGG